MTLTTSTNKISFAGDGSTVSIPITFVFWDDTDIKAILRDAADAETTWVDGTQYTLTGGSGTTGTLTVKTTPTDYTPASGETLIIKSIRADTQDITFPTGGSFPSASAEEGLDKVVRLVQQKDEELDRSLKLGETSPTSGLTFPEPVADNLVGWNEAGDDLANISIANVSTSVDTTLTSLASGDMLRHDGTVFRNRTAVQTRSDLAVPGTGTVNTFTKTQTLTKGADLTPATSAITLGTDGNYFDVAAGNFATINGVSGTPFTLQMDGVSVLTHNGTTLDLPGEVNFTSAAGDIIKGFMTGAATAQITGITKADGKAVVDTDTVTNTQLVSSTYDLTTATGTKAITGAGFQPSAVEITWAVQGGETATSIGYHDGTDDHCTYWDESSVVTFDGINSFYYKSAAGTVTGDIASLDADGCTMNLTKTTSPTGTVNLSFKFIKY